MPGGSQRVQDDVDAFRDLGGWRGHPDPDLAARVVEASVGRPDDRDRVLTHESNLTTNGRMSTCLEPAKSASGSASSTPVPPIRSSTSTGSGSVTPPWSATRQPHPRVAASRGPG